MEVIERDLSRPDAAEALHAEVLARGLQVRVCVCVCVCVCACVCVRARAGIREWEARTPRVIFALLLLQVDMLVNNAGFGLVGPVVNSSVGDARRVIDLNVTTVT